MPAPQAGTTELASHAIDHATDDGNGDGDAYYNQSADDEVATANSQDAHGAPSGQPHETPTPLGPPARNTSRDGAETGPEPDGADDQGCDEAPYLGALPNGALRVKCAHSIIALAPYTNGTWHPLVHDIAPRVLAKLDANSRSS
jgi:hypothetical protein